MNKNLALAIACIVIIAAITLLSAIPIKFTIREETIQTVQSAQVIPIIEEGKGSGPVPGPIVHRLYIENTFIPKQ